MVGVSSLAAGHNTLVPALKKILRDSGADHVLLAVGGVIPHGDYEFLFENGADLIMGPGTRVTDASNKIIDKLEQS